MPVILYTVFVVSLLPILLAWLGGYYRVRQFGQMDNHHPRLQQAQLTGIGARVLAAQQNSWEALLVYLSCVFIAFAAGADLNRLDTLALAFVALRVLHALFYIANWAWWRSGVFALSMVCCLAIVYQAARGG